MGSIGAIIPCTNKRLTTPVLPTNCPVCFGSIATEKPSLLEGGLAQKSRKPGNQAGLSIVFPCSFRSVAVTAAHLFLFLRIVGVDFDRLGHQLVAHGLQIGS
jgi:hypothetical protein